MTTRLSLLLAVLSATVVHHAGESFPYSGRLKASIKTTQLYVVSDQSATTTTLEVILESFGRLLEDLIRERDLGD